MVESDLNSAFDDCIDRLADGYSVDDCLRRYPDLAASLRPMLEAGLLARRALYPASEVAQAQYRVHLRVAQATADVAPLAVNRRAAPARRWLSMVATLIVVFAALLAGAAFGADSSLPGDTLYPFKLMTESVRLALSNNSALSEQFARRRTDEIKQLLALGREAQVDFTGEVQAIDGQDWQVAGLDLDVAPTIPEASLVRVGDEVAVTARTTSNSELVAITIKLVDERREQLPLTDTPVSTPTNAPTTTATLMPTNTRRPTATATNTLAIQQQLPIVTPTSEVCLPSQPDGWVIYSIRAGDTLSGLAGSTGISLEELMRVNCLTNPGLIVAGQKLFLPFAPPTPLPPTATTHQSTPVPPFIPTVVPAGSSGSQGSSNDSGGNDDGGDNNGGDDGNDDHSGPGGGGNDSSDDHSGSDDSGNG
jgi:hypothetical protein